MELSVICTDPMLAWAATEWAGRVPGVAGCRTMYGTPGSEDDAGADVLVIMPQTWEEMQRWRPWLQRRFGQRPWLVRSRLRIAGLFLTTLEQLPLCEIVGSLATPEQFAEGL